MSQHDETQGSKIALYVPVSGTQTLVAARRDFELSESTDTREVTSTAAGTYKEFVPGAQEWEISLSYVLLIDEATGSLEASQKALQDAHRNQNIITTRVTYPGGVEDQGDGLITNLTTAANYDEIGSVDAAIQGSGPIVRQ
jgi:predicted secreted protein